MFMEKNILLLDLNQGLIFSRSESLVTINLITYNLLNILSFEYILLEIVNREPVPIAIWFYYEYGMLILLLKNIC